MNYVNCLRRNKRKQGGYTMLELLLVIGIIIALTAVMIYALLSRANKQAAFTQAGAQVAQIANAERNALSTSGQGAVEIKDLGQYGLSQDIATNADYANPWGGSYTLDTSSVSNGQFSVKVNGVPADVSNGYKRFLHQISLIGEESADSKQAACTQTNTTITCTFDNA